jgi:hypothetical protein
MISRYTLRTDKMRTTPVRESRFRSPDAATKASLLCDVLSKPTGEAAEDGNLIN